MIAPYNQKKTYQENDMEHKACSYGVQSHSRTQLAVILAPHCLAPHYPLAPYCLVPHSLVPHCLVPHCLVSHSLVTRMGPWRRERYWAREYLVARDDQ